MKALNKKIVAAALACILAFPISANAFPKDLDKTSSEAMITDTKSGRIIFERNQNKQRPIASMTKVMTLYVTLDAIKNKQVSFDDVITVNNEDTKIIGSNMHLKVGQQIKLIDLLRGMMVVSANDGALAIARHVGKGSVPAFVKKMNEKAKSIGMFSTHYYNPNGLPIIFENSGNSIDEENTSTAKDMIRLGRSILKDYEKEVTSITGLKKLNVDGKEIFSTNPLMDKFPKTDGLKTGFTDNAGYCLIYTYPVESKVNPEASNRILGISMGNKSSDIRKETCLKSLGYVLNNYMTAILYNKEQKIATRNINEVSGLPIEIASKTPVLALMKNGETFRKDIKFFKVKGIEKGKVIGTMSLIDADGQRFGKYDIIALNGTQSFSFLGKVKYFFITLYNTVRYINNDDPKDTITTVF